MKKLTSLIVVASIASSMLFAESAPANNNMMGNMQNMMNSGMGAMQNGMNMMQTAQGGMQSAQGMMQGSNPKDMMMNMASDQTGITTLDMVNKMPEDMQMKLKYDGLVNMPILMRATSKHADNKELNLTDAQKMAIKKNKLEVMDTIEPVLKEAHQLSIKLKQGLFDGSLDQKEAVEIAKKIANLKEQVLEMKITCTIFMRETLSKEQFQKLLELDKKMPYLNSPYNY